MPAIQEDYSPLRDITDYLSALFEPEDKVCVVTTASKDDDGKWKPYGGSASRTCKQLLDSLKRPRETSISDTFGTTNDEAGVWICFNPMDGTSRKNSSVTSFRYALVESAAVHPSGLTNAMIRPALASSYWLIRNKSFSN